MKRVSGNQETNELMGFLKKYRLDLLAVFLLTFTLPLFFYNLGQSSLVSWDEAWYAEISRNILKTGDFFNMRWNDMAYYDHPVTGYWLIAASEAIFGQTEFGVRAASAIFGFLALVVTYFLGKVMFNRVVGWCSALGLCSSFWFLYRARSGNLDVFLTCFFLLTFLTAWRAKDSRGWLIPFGICFALLALTKTVVPFTIVPALVIIFWGSKYSWKDNLGVLGLIVVIGGIWPVSQFLTDPSFLDRYLMIGFPGVGVKTSYWDNFMLAKTYLHDGIGRWFWFGVLGVGGSLVIGVIEKSKKWLVFPVFWLIFFTPFVFSAKGHIWHLIPLHPVMILSFFAAAFWMGEKILGYLDKIIRRQDIRILRKFPNVQQRNSLVSLSLILSAFYLSYFQLRSAWVQFIDQPKYISDEQILSSEAGKNEGQFFIDDDFGPAAVWYSEKKVMQIRDDDVSRLFNKRGKFAQVKQFLMITKQYRLDDQGIAKERYKILKSDRDKILVISVSDQ